MKAIYFILSLVNIFLLLLCAVLLSCCAVLLVAVFRGLSQFCPPHLGQPRSSPPPRPAPSCGGRVVPFVLLGSPFSGRSDVSLFSSRGLRPRELPPAGSLRSPAGGGYPYAVLHLDTGLVALCECYISAVNLCKLTGGAVFNLTSAVSTIFLSYCRQLWMS